MKDWKFITQKQNTLSLSLKCVLLVFPLRVSSVTILALYMDIRTRGSGSSLATGCLAEVPVLVKSTHTSSFQLSCILCFERYNIIQQDRS